MVARALLFAVVLVLVAAPAAEAKRAKPPSCANTDLMPTADNLELIRDAVACLHNRTRVQRRLRALTSNRALARAAAGHADDMVARGYFEHETPEGEHFDQRILAAGYVREFDGWKLGENLIWASGDLATPAALMRSWMESGGHRANILKPEFRELGLGLTFGTPSGGTGVTIAAEFGARN